MAVCAAAEQAEKACQHAEELFLAGDVDGAHAEAENAKRLCPSLPFVDNAVAAYEVHLRARAGGGGWRAVLGLGPGGASAGDGPASDAATQDAVRKEFRRLSLLVHPDKAHSAAAAAVGAFRLIRDAQNEALPPPPPPPPSPPRSSHDPAAADRDTTSTPPQKPPQQQQPARRAKKVTVLMMMTQQAAAAAAHGPREPTLIYCPWCEREFRGMVGRRERRDGMRCARCPAWLTAPWRTKPRAEKKPAAAPGRRVFQCPAACPRCGERYASAVCVGRWCLQCKACSLAAMVDVLGPDQATASVKRRACVS